MLESPMSNEIAPILAELRQDHRNMVVLLDLLEAEADKLYSDDSPDFALMLEIMHYMTVYPDSVHHPKEDRIYAELKAARPDLAKGMAHITDEHRTIAENSLALRDKLEQVVSGNFVRRNDVVGDAVRYIDGLRRHMRWEESDLFRRIDRMIADGHATVDAAILISRGDPLFGSHVEERFKPVFERIKNSS